MNCPLCTITPPLCTLCNNPETIFIIGICGNQHLDEFWTCNTRHLSYIHCILCEENNLHWIAHNPGHNITTSW